VSAPHGTVRRYDQGCDCNACKLARTARERELNPDRNHKRTRLEVAIDLGNADTSWMGSAACAGHDVDLWFPDTLTDATIAKAVAICDRCPVKERCLAYALAHIDNGRDEAGIWGGMTGRERINYRRRQQRAQRRGQAS